MIRTAPPELNIAGVGDLFSIHTASFDWKLAESAGKSEYPFSANTVSQASDIIEMLRKHKQDIRECNDEGLWAIVEGCMRLNTLACPPGISGWRKVRSITFLRTRRTVAASVHSRSHSRPGDSSDEPPAKQQPGGNNRAHE
ncbi:MAG: iron-containing alcohol dehydrogenase [Acidobacteria bacterium]|nr:iron-containing alcohol dehydrogenase [Acidobacteriota bacterium]